jgi:hypothetical protein
MGMGIAYSIFRLFIGEGMDDDAIRFKNCGIPPTFTFFISLANPP